MQPLACLIPCQDVFWGSVWPSWRGSKHHCSPDCKTVDKNFMSPFIGTIYSSFYVFPVFNISGSLFRKPRIEFYSHLYKVLELLLWIFHFPDLNIHLNSCMKYFTSEDREEPYYFTVSLTVMTPWAEDRTCTLSASIFRKLFLTFFKGHAPHVRHQFQGSVWPQQCNPQEARRQFSSTWLSRQCWFKLLEADCE